VSHNLFCQSPLLLFFPYRRGANYVYEGMQWRRDAVGQMQRWQQLLVTCNITHSGFPQQCCYMTSNVSWDLKGIDHFGINFWYVLAYLKGIQVAGVFVSTVVSILIFLGQTVLVCQSRSSLWSPPQRVCIENPKLNLIQWLVRCNPQYVIFMTAFMWISKLAFDWTLPNKHVFS